MDTPVSGNATGASYLSPPPRNSLYDRPLTAPADRPARAPVHAGATAIRGAGSVHREPACRRRSPSRVTRDAPHRRPRLSPGKPTAGVAGHSHSPLRQPPPHVVAIGTCRGPRCGLPPASSAARSPPGTGVGRRFTPPLRAAAHDSGPPYAATTTLPSYRRTRRTGGAE